MTEVYESRRFVDHTTQGSLECEDGVLVLGYEGERDEIYKIEISTSWGDPYKRRWIADRDEFEATCTNLEKYGCKLLWMLDKTLDDMRLTAYGDGAPSKVVLASYRMTDTMQDDMRAYEEMFVR